MIISLSFSLRINSPESPPEQGFVPRALSTRDSVAPVGLWAPLAAKLVMRQGKVSKYVGLRFRDYLDSVVAIDRNCLGAILQYSRLGLRMKTMTICPK
jgi:hypothetical protein